MGLLLGFVYAPRPALAQEPSTHTSDSVSVDSFRKALATPRFYALAVATPPSFTDLTRIWKLDLTPIAAPAESHSVAGGGIDLLQLVQWVIQAHRDREVRLIRERIDRELQALTGTQ